MHNDSLNERPMYAPRGIKLVARHRQKLHSKFTLDVWAQKVMRFLAEVFVITIAGIAITYVLIGWLDEGLGLR